jgi:hypothetical protein
MHKTHLIPRVLSAGILFIFAQAHGQSDDCNAIKDADKQNYCKATTSGKPAFCAKVSNNDTRNLCLAKTHNQARYCQGISNAKTKDRCLQSIR